MSIELKNVKVGKYYADKSSAVRVDKFDSFGEPEGVAVNFFEDYFSVCIKTDLYHFFDGVNRMREITKEEFEQKLQVAQEHLSEMYKTIKSH